MTDLFVGSLTAADAERIRALINPETLPSKANAVTGGAGTIPACVVCGRSPCTCPEPEGVAA